MDHSKILLAVIAAVITSCADFRESEAIPAGLSLNVEDLIFPEEGSTETLTVRSGRKWSVMEEKPDWITIESIGSHSAYMYEWPITLNAESNAGYDRDDSLFFKAGEETKKLFVYQRGVKGAYVALESVSISPRTLTLVKGEKEKLSVVLYPSSASEQSVVWSSSNTSVATVSPEGVVTASEVGTSTITVKANDGGKTATCQVFVQAHEVAVNGVSLSATSMSLIEGESQTLVASVTPLNATDKSVSWYSSDYNIADVSSSGIVKAKSAGTATITVETNDGAKTASCKVLVNPAKVSVTGVSLDKTSLSMTEGETYTLTATVTPSNVTDKSVTWSSNKTSVATVSSTGVVTAKAAGTATITVMTNDGGKSAACSVTVNAATIPVTGVSLDRTSLSMMVGETQALTATVAPSNATDKAVTWFSDESSVATVSSSGVVSAKAVGTATIVVFTHDGGECATCIVSVGDGIRLDKTSLFMITGETQTLTATVTSDKPLIWSSDNTFVAGVSSSGVVTARRIGTATITVTTTDGKYTASCLVTVRNNSGLESVSFDHNSIKMAIGESRFEHVSIKGYSDDVSVSVSSSNPSVVQVSYSGLVGLKAESLGTAIITLSASDGERTVKAVCTVIVERMQSGAVDLGLPSGLKWASCNLGAVAPEESGASFAWAETETKSVFGWETYKWCNGSSRSLTKYNSDSNYGVVDNKTYLDLDDDAAHVILGGNWHIPSIEDYRELMNNCTREDVAIYGAWGVMFTGRNGNRIFIQSHRYWSSELGQYPSSASLFNIGYFYTTTSNRCQGNHIRPVTY